MVRVRGVLVDPRHPGVDCGWVLGQFAQLGAPTRHAPPTGGGEIDALLTAHSDTG